MVRGFELSLVELDVVGESLGLDVRPFPFTGGVPVHGRSAQERRRLVDGVADSLAARGLLSGDGFVEDVERLLAVFAQDEVSVAMVGIDRRPHCLRAAVRGGEGVLAEQQGEVMCFRPVAPESVAHEVFAGVAALGPGPGSSVSITAPDELPVRYDDWGDDVVSRSYLEAAGSRGPQWALVEQIVRRPRLGGGYVTVGARGWDADPLTMTWIDTDAGRYAILPSRAADGRLHVTYVPADVRRLEQGLAELLATVSNGTAAGQERNAMALRRSVVDSPGGSRRDRGVWPHDVGR